MLKSNSGSGATRELWFMLGGSPGLVVMGRDLQSEGCGFDSHNCILDGHLSHIFVA